MCLTAEIEELSGRLKASRQRVADLERNFTTASNSSQKNEKVSLSCSQSCVLIDVPAEFDERIVHKFQLMVTPLGEIYLLIK